MGGVVVALIGGEAVDAIPDTDSVVVPFFVALVPFVISGLFLSLRRPLNPIGWLLMGVAFFWTVASAVANYRSTC